MSFSFVAFFKRSHPKQATAILTAASDLKRRVDVNNFSSRACIFRLNEPVFDPSERGDETTFNYEHREVISKLAHE